MEETEPAAGTTIIKENTKSDISGNCGHAGRPKLMALK
jgi:hypothetical protein